MKNRKQVTATTPAKPAIAPTAMRLVRANELDGATARGRTVASLRPDISAAMVMNEYIPLEEVDVAALAQTLADEIEQVQRGDLKDVEAILYGQAQTLHAIFSHLARSAAKQGQPKQWEAFMRMALKAQNQCRMTLDTLATIKNPTVVIARQANISHGHQQVNNGTGS